MTLSYQWYHSGYLPLGANGPTYTPGPGPGSIGRPITVKITASKPGYTTTTKTSAPTPGTSK